MAACPFCAGDGGALVARGEKLRIVRAKEAGYPAFYRVVWNEHRPELSDLSPEDRALCMDAVVCVERALREALPPELAADKINLAALGNMVPHLHWHVIARHRWDDRFPAPFWAPAVRETPAEKVAALAAALPAVEARMCDLLAQAGLAQPSTHAQ